FVPQEGPVWDFKREWPFSYSDDYFAGIARLICAFANSYGGIIVFGVHDELRTADTTKFLQTSIAFNRHLIKFFPHPYPYHVVATIREPRPPLMFFLSALSIRPSCRFDSISHLVSSAQTSFG